MEKDIINRTLPIAEIPKDPKRAGLLSRSATISALERPIPNIGQVALITPSAKIVWYLLGTLLLGLQGLLAGCATAAPAAAPEAFSNAALVQTSYPGPPTPQPTINPYPGPLPASPSPTPQPTLPVLTPSATNVAVTALPATGTPGTATATSRLPTPTVTSRPAGTPLVGANTPIPPSLAPISLRTAGQVEALAIWRQDAVNDLAWLPGSDTLAAAGFNTIRIYSARTRALEQTLQPRGAPGSLDFRPDGGLLAAGTRIGTQERGYSGSVEFWRVPSWNYLGPYYTNIREVSDIAFSQERQLFAAAFASPAFENDLVQIWDTPSLEITRTIDLGTVLQIAFSADGELLATSPDRYAIKVWSLKNGKLISTFYTSFTGAVNSLAFSPDGDRLASGHYDGAIRIWDTTAGNLLLTLRTQGVVESLAYSPDGRVLASGESYEGHRVRLWDADTGSLLNSLEGFQHAVGSLRFSPDGQLLASGSYDGVLRLWGVPP